MNGYNTITNTSTYTVVDIRKTFEGFSADLRMIALRTGKWTTLYVENVLHDILELAEAKYLKSVDITLVDVAKTPIRASKYTINDSGSALNSDRPGGNNWPNLPSTFLTVILNYNAEWHNLTAEQRTNFENDKNFKASWTNTDIDIRYLHLTNESGQLYGSKGYELQKVNYK